MKKIQVEVQATYIAEILVHDDERFHEDDVLLEEMDDLIFKNKIDPINMKITSKIYQS